MLKNPTMLTQLEWAELKLNSGKLAPEFTFLTMTRPLFSNNNENFPNGILIQLCMLVMMCKVIFTGYVAHMPCSILLHDYIESS